MTIDELAFIRKFPNECTEGVTRKGEFQPCDKPAVAARRDPEEGGWYPVCSHHARGSLMVPLAELVRTPITVEEFVSRHPEYSESVGA